MPEISRFLDSPNSGFRYFEITNGWVRYFEISARLRHAVSGFHGFAISTHGRNILAISRFWVFDFRFFAISTHLDLGISSFWNFDVPGFYDFEISIFELSAFLRFDIIGVRRPTPPGPGQSGRRPN